MLKGFRDFIMRGNVVELAIGVVIGVAFNALVTSLTKDFINPLIAVFGGGKDMSGKWTIGTQVFGWGDFVSALINFLLVAAVLYFLVVLPLNKFNEGRMRFFKKGGETAEPEPVTLPPDLELLTQIRDALLANQRLLENATGSGSGAPAQRTGGSQPVTDTTTP